MHLSAQNAGAAPYLKGLRAESEIILKNAGTLSLNAFQSLEYFNTGYPWTQSSSFPYVSMSFNVLFHCNFTLKCSEVAQPQMINQAKYGNLTLASSNLCVRHNFSCPCICIHGSSIVQAYYSFFKFKYIIIHLYMSWFYGRSQNK